MIFIDFHWFSLIFITNPWKSMKINEIQWKSLNPAKKHWCFLQGSMIFIDFHNQSMKINGNHWKSMKHRWTSMNIYNWFSLFFFVFSLIFIEGSLTSIELHWFNIIYLLFFFSYYYYTFFNAIESST